MSEERAEWVKSLVDKHRVLLNRLESHLGCVTCRGALVDGRCLTCDPKEESI